ADVFAPLVRASEASSVFGAVEVTGVAVALLSLWLVLTGRRRLAARLLAAFVATGVLELVMKHHPPQAPLPGGFSSGAPEQASVLSPDSPYPYPSGHIRYGG
ncbi:MAG: hypothetical protein CYG60_01955, partial [Actinobacteria bacterium]